MASPVQMQVTDSDGKKVVKLSSGVSTFTLTAAQAISLVREILKRCGVTL